MAPTRAEWKRERGATATDGILNGTKRWITNGSIADVAIVWAKVDGRHHRILGREGNPWIFDPAISMENFRCAHRSPRS